MLLNANEVESLMQTNGKGAKAQVGYDLTLKSASLIGDGGQLSQSGTELPVYMPLPVDETMGDYFYFRKGLAYSLTFEQGVELKNNTTGFVRHRSSILRMGGVITSGVYDPGFKVDNCGAILLAHCNFAIQQGARLAQLIVFENNKADTYNGQWQGKKDKK